MVPLVADYGALFDVLSRQRGGLNDNGCCAGCKGVATTTVFAAQEVLGSFPDAAQGSLDPAAGIWSAACFVYRLLTGCYLQGC